VTSGSENAEQNFLLLPQLLGALEGGAQVSNHPDRATLPLVTDLNVTTCF